ncbi:hypothetical protein BIW11_13405 [Tropilaelaps mercedesae]|uniref:Phosphatidylinositol-specific phospholipase C X domain-containing protein n=1 Tax=Tropilaelaps mercedesae TaxID=418985 RepID=A0A1V9X2K1_9ACAR|nr:hypothetical protein BIW11_13405 [Tropilaelaps mercedesae]
MLHWQTAWSPTNLPNGSYLYTEFLLDDKVIRTTQLLAPDWMKVQYKHIESLNLSQLAIPGSHRSGAYRRYVPEDKYTKIWFAYCQTEDVFTQLLYGIRALDVHVCAVVKDSESCDFWIVNGKIEIGHKLDPILDDIRQFLELFPTELVFLDLKSRCNLACDELSNLISLKFGDKLYQRAEGQSIQDFMSLTVGQMIASGKKIVIGMDDLCNFQDRNLPAFQRIFIDTQNLEELQKGLLRAQKESYRANVWFFVSLGIIVPYVPFDLFFPFSLTWSMPWLGEFRWGSRAIGTSAAAADNNFHICEWYSINFKIQATVNVISLDHATSSDIVAACILINKKRANHEFDELPIPIPKKNRILIADIVTRLIYENNIGVLMALRINKKQKKTKPNILLFADGVMLFVKREFEKKKVLGK